MKMVNIQEENLHIFWKTWEISIKFSLTYNDIKSHKKHGWASPSF